MADKCELCGKPKATAEDWENIPEGEGDHLCWRSQGDEANCMSEAMAVERLNKIARDKWANDATEYRKEADRLKIQLDAWQQAFGTSQLTHALATMELAKAKNERLKGLLAAIVDHYHRQENKYQGNYPSKDGPGHDHDVAGVPDGDSEPCEWCKIWGEVLKEVGK